MSAAAYHRLVWIDHAVSHVYAFTQEGLTALTDIYAHDSGGGHVHHKAGTPGPGHEGIDTALLKLTADALQGAGQILITGPGQARHALSIHLQESAPGLAQRVIGVEALDRCAAPELHSFARHFFARADRMRGS